MWLVDDTVLAWLVDDTLMDSSKNRCLNIPFPYKYCLDLNVSLQPVYKRVQPVRTFEVFGTKDASDRSGARRLSFSHQIVMTLSGDVIDVGKTPSYISGFSCKALHTDG